MAQIVKPDILDPGTFANEAPKRQKPRKRLWRVHLRREDVLTTGTRLALDDRTRFAVEVHFPRAGLAVHKAECVVADFIPFQVRYLSCRSSKPHRPQKSWHFSPLPTTVCYMKTIVMILVAFVHEIVLSRATLQLENVALRQQVAVLKRERPRPRLHPLDRVFWVLLFHLWPRWKDALVIVKPETVIGWHRRGFRLFWKWKSCHGKPGRPRTSKEIRELIQRMSRENPLWGAPRNHGELLKLGIDVSQATVT